MKKMEVTLFDRSKKIILQVVGDNITAKDVDDATVEMLKIAKGLGTGWKVLLDLRQNNIISPDGQQGVIRQQKAAIENGCVMVASVVPTAIKKLQQSKLLKEANNTIDTMFVKIEDAVEFLKKH